MKTITIKGEYATAVVYTTDNPKNSIESSALNQIKALCNFEASEGSTIRVMPDVHAGKGCVIGLTATVANAVMPNLVGVDIGCGVLIAHIHKYTWIASKLDKELRESIPAGFSIHEKQKFDFPELQNLCCAKHVDLDRALCSLGTLGGGNHFIELGFPEEGGMPYVTIHSGSRRLGKEVCEWYLKQGRKEGVPYELTYLTGDLREQYLHDMEIVQRFAKTNRECILKTILGGCKWKVDTSWESVHNYIDFSYQTPILRKGAISAKDGEKVVIPCNMLHGSIIGIGKGNKDWNYSAPHGAGRVCSRTQVKQNHTVSEFKKVMKGVYSSTINESTLDEAPFAYRDMQDIKEAVSNTVEIINVIKPVYNFKAGSVND